VVDQCAASNPGLRDVSLEKTAELRAFELTEQPRESVAMKAVTVLEKFHHSTKVRHDCSPDGYLTQVGPAWEAFSGGA
jgi:hypothetical protein